MVIIMIKIFLTNLGIYNEGSLVGEWLELPATQEEIDTCLNNIGIGEEYEEYFITDFESDIDGLHIGEYESLEELNTITEALQDVDTEIIEALLYHGYSLEDIESKVNDCIIYYDCNDMEDVAIEYIEECGLLNDVPEHLQSYFDYEAYGRDMDLEGRFYFANGNCIQILG